MSRETQIREETRCDPMTFPFESGGWDITGTLVRLFDIVNLFVAQWVAPKSVPRTRGDEPIQ